MSCAACFAGASATGTPKGTTAMLHGEQTYTALPPSSPPTDPPTKTIILYPDAFSHRLKNNLLVADALAARTRARVLVPDIVPGGGMAPVVLDYMDVVMNPQAGVLRRVWSLLKAMRFVLPFYQRAAPTKPVCMRRCVKFARGVRGEVGPQGRVGVVGYCWGGRMGLGVAEEVSLVSESEGGDELDKPKGLVDALFVAHPAKFAPEHLVAAVTKHRTPVSFAHAGSDMSLSKVTMEAAQAALAELPTDKGYVHEVRVYEDCAHGFAVRTRPGNKKEVEAADKALMQAVDWFNRWL